MKRKFRLTRSRDFKRVKEVGSVVYHPLMLLVYAKNEEPHSRAAVVASKKIGNAVNRNKVKRRIRACLDLIWPRILPSWDFIFYSRVKIAEVKIEDMQQAIYHLLCQADVLGEE